MQTTIQTFIAQIWLTVTGQKPALVPVRIMSRSEIIMMRRKQWAMERNRF